MKTVDQLMAEEFAKPHARRSPEYKAGFRDVLEWKINGKEPTFPYPGDTAQADAYFFGVEDGAKNWKRNQGAGKKA